MAARDMAIAIKPEPDQHIAAESFDNGDAFAGFASRVHVSPEIALGQATQNLIDQRETLLDLAYADPYPRVDITRVQHGDLERQFVVRRVSEVTPCIKGASRRATDIAACAESMRVLRFH